MPVRPRRRQHRLHLSLIDFINLSIGPRQDLPVQFDRLHAVYHEHASRFDTSSWAFRYFELGIDDRVPMELDPEQPVGCPGLPCDD
jgi:hypothetical protein